MSWIEEELEEIKLQKDQKEAAREWSLHKAEILRSKSLQIWCSVMEQVKADVAFLVSTYKREVEFIEVPARTLTVKNNSRPTVEVTASIRLDGRMIDLKTREVQVPLGFTEEKTDIISVDIDENENVQFSYFGRCFDSLEDVSRLILAPILKAYRASR